MPRKLRVEYPGAWVGMQKAEGRMQKEMLKAKG